MPACADDCKILGSLGRPLALVTPTSGNSGEGSSLASLCESGFFPSLKENETSSYPRLWNSCPSVDMCRRRRSNVSGRSATTFTTRPASVADTESRKRPSSSGLREISNPSEILISKKDADLSGTAIASTLEGIRPLMIEVQALVSTAVYGTPQRSTTGYNLKRLHMILAVLEKRAGFKLGAKDVFLNITGGINVDDPAIDLAVVASILSSNQAK